MPTSLIPESHRDLLDTCQVAVLATINPDGFPQVSAVWFLVDEDGTIAVSLTTARQKYKNLKRRPEASLLFIDPENPYRTLEVRARAELTPDPDYTFAERIGAKYNANLRQWDEPGTVRYMVRFTPVKVNTWG
ncbi:MAG TPA: PPOX class F420-dependent oxidoreductase [Thermomicrobiales bacterium]|jgi:PPOX class probable F420-dependent enzyme